MDAVGHSALRQYSSATGRALSAVDKTTDFWTQGAQTLTDRLPGLPQIDLIPAVERYFDFVQAHDKARERYESLTKAELSGQLAKRQLPKSGNVDELIERLAEADSK